MKASDIPEDVRAEMDGKGAEPKTFVVWMNEQTPAEQDRLFGSLNASRWRAGRITQTELLRQNGRALAVSQFAAEPA
jgi:hypothetical protein